MKSTNKILVSLVFVITVAFVTHYFFVGRMQSKDSDNREVASFGERNSPEQIKWEHRLAQELSGGKTQSQLPSQPSWQDVFMYEFLKGQYKVSLNKGQIDKIQLLETQPGLNIDIQKFMSDYAPKMKNYAQFEIKKIDEKTDVIELKDQAGQSTGSFLFSKNETGHVTEISVR